ncbi:hypothetical protein DUNSADRAFT_13168 [Dunaliella salina]|uniref:Ysc84 actin-binding domain-containing protein n=1 Tax=Dunaliella salina TaxID=3046 RepID=A0ABQ7G9X6_DUNSA|nr:hypothetical protein DUNSADRAFT_13168 [Dunaliella salina]|eukprot:KAF5831407.1 hypothetical protein DUNSADRAFT_13168 [Dunaliella salina]
MTTRHNDDLFRRLSAFAQDDEKRERKDHPVNRITQGRTYLYRQAQWASQLLQELAEGVDPATRLPPQVINSCEALCFTNAQKGGLGFTGGYGYGFIIKKVKQEEDGTSKWSPPFFFTISQAGMGVAFGYQHCQTVAALVNQSAIGLFTSGGFTAGSDMGFYSTDGALTGMAAGILGWRQQRSQKDGFSYSHVMGAYTEYGVHGSRVGPDWSTNSKLYESVNGADVLQGLVTRRFPEVDCLYEVINKLGKEAAAAENSSLAAGSISRVSGVTDTTEVPEVPPPQPVALAPAQVTDNQPSLVYAAQEVA